MSKWKRRSIISGILLLIISSTTIFYLKSTNLNFMEDVLKIEGSEIESRQFTIFLDDDSITIPNTSSDFDELESILFNLKVDRLFRQHTIDYGVHFNQNGKTYAFDYGPEGKIYYKGKKYIILDSNATEKINSIIEHYSSLEENK